METKKLSGLQPEAVFGYFEQICSMPHGSGNTKQISDYLVAFAKEHNLRYVQDALNNVILFSDGTCGMEDHEPVIRKDSVVFWFGITSGSEPESEEPMQLRSTW